MIQATRDRARAIGGGRSVAVDIIAWFDATGVEIGTSGRGKGNSGSGCCPSWIHGQGYGATPGDAWNEAWDAADFNTPRGCQKRHCRGIAGSCKGREGGKTLTRSIRTIRASARRGNDRDQCLLGALYATGEGVDLSYPEAVKWYELASASGNAEALYNLATMYWLGEGVARNRRKALRLLRKAEALGSSDAALLLGQSSLEYMRRAAV